MCSNYCGIWLLQPPSKLYTKCILSHLERVVDCQQLRAKDQSDFKKFHKLEDNALVLLTLEQYWRLLKRGLSLCLLI